MLTFATKNLARSSPLAQMEILSFVRAVLIELSWVNAAALKQFRRFGVSVYVLARACSLELNWLGDSVPVRDTEKGRPGLWSGRPSLAGQFKIRILIQIIGDVARPGWPA